MFCTRCGVEVVGSAAFCAACGAPTGLGVDPAAALKRPGLVTLLAVLQFIAAAIWLPVGVFLLVSAGESDPAGQGIAMFLGLLTLGIGAVALACGIGLWTLRPYGRTLQIVLAVIGLLAIPIGTIISILVLIYMLKPGARALFSGKSPSALTPAELAEINAVTQGSNLTAAITVLCIVVGGFVMIGIVAAIAVPGLLRARMAGNESSAIGSMRMVVSAQASYAAAGGGGAYATRLSTLAVPCPGSSQAFITPDLAQDPSTKSGYVISLESAGAAPGPNDCNNVQTELDFYATATPQQFQTTGMRAFSTSARGEIFVDGAGTPPSREETLTRTGTLLR